MRTVARIVDALRNGGSPLDVAGRLGAAAVVSAVLYASACLLLIAGGDL